MQPGSQDIFRPSDAASTPRSGARMEWRRPVAGGQEARGPRDIGRLELVRIDADHWLIHDHRFAQTDPRRIVACIEESDDGLDVAWVASGVPLPRRYRTTDDILEDLKRWRQGSRRDTRPVDIASYRPPSSRGGSR